jgi:alpha-tubulin suppressor-like RCC1 family protein
MLITIKSLSTKVKFVAVGSAHAIAIMNNNNTVFAWGKNKFGECGQSKTKHEIFVPSKIKAFGTDSIITMAACGENHTIFLMGNNSV